MRVLVVVHGFPPSAQGGSEIYAYEHARALKREHAADVVVLTREADSSRAEYAVRRETRDGLSIVWVNNTFRNVRSFEETYRNAAIDAIAARVVDECRPDVAHLHHLTCLSTGIVDVLSERNIPSVFTLHDYWLICHRGQLLDLEYRVCDGPERSGCRSCVGDAGAASSTAFMTARAVRAMNRIVPERAGRIVRRTAGGLARAVASADRGDRRAAARVSHMQEVCGRIDRFLAPSKCMRDRFVKFGVAPERIVLSPYGFDHRPFDRTSRRSSPRLRLGFLGSLMISKAPHVLLEAASRLPAGSVSVDLFGAHVAYHGDDSYRSKLDRLLTAECVSAHGPLPHEKIPDALASIDVLVVPSIWPENSPLVIQEAFLAGVPVVASRIGGIPEVVRDGVNGLLFEPGDWNSLRDALARLVQEPGLLDRLRGGISAVRTIEDDVRNAGVVYEETIAARRRQRRAARDRRLAAVVLNYRTADETLLAVKALLASRRRFDDVIVVDNGCDEDCKHALTPIARQLEYIATGRNLGFSGGVNVGIRAALDRGADAVMLVNSDVIVPPDCVGHLEASLERMVRPAIVSPVVLARTDPSHIASLGMSYDARTGRMKHKSVGSEIDSLELTREQKVDGVSGCAMLIDRAVFDAIGLLDEDYFFTFEDLDFCLRARRAGFETAVVGAARVHHEGSRSMGAGSPRRLYFATRNHLLMAAKNSPGASRVGKFCRAAFIVMLNVAHAAISPSGTVPARTRAVAEGLRDYVAGAVGDGPPARRAAR